MLISEIIQNWLRDVHAVNVTTRSHKVISEAVYNHLIPAVEELRVSNANAKELLLRLNSIKHASTRRSMLSVLSNSFDYAVICEQATHNPAISLRKYIKKNDYIYKPFAVLPKSQWQRFFYDIEQMTYPKITKTLFWTIAYSALRRAEATSALKSEFDFNAETWTVPANRMKNKKEHIVYLSPTLKLMLVELFSSNSSKYAFPSSHKGADKPLADWAAYAILRKSRYNKKQTLHGLRKIFSSHAHESGLFNSDAIELSIDHRIRGVRGVYNVAQYEQERRHLAKWYGSELDRWRGIRDMV